MEQWKEYKLGEILNFRRGYDLPKDKMSGGKYPVAGSTGIIGYHNVATPISPCITIGRSGSIGQPRYYDKCWAHNTTLYIDDYKGNDPKFLYYFLMTIPLCEMGAGSAVPTLNRNHIHPLKVVFPTNVELQRRIAAILSSLDDKIEVNRRINDNLEQQAQALFRSWFVDFEPFGGDDTTVEEYLTPKRGKNLLTKDAAGGDVPVVAGGLEPSCYHNVANTKAPVITISASGANAGFVNLWNCPVWSADSSYIDNSITPYVYFWYNLLKYRQKEIFDSQTGSAQPHIYPQHISAIHIPALNMEKVARFNDCVKSLYLTIGEKQTENLRLSETRDTLLPKLMSGEISVKC